MTERRKISWNNKYQLDLGNSQSSCLIKPRGSHIDDSLKFKILKEFYDKKEDQDFNFTSTLCFIFIRLKNSQRIWRSPSSFNKMFENKQYNIDCWSRAQQKMKEFIENETWCYDSVNIHNYLKQTLGLNIARSSITSHLKNHFNYSFKRVSSRPILADPIRWIILKAIFWAEFGNIMEDRLVYVNVDEVLFTKSTKINYSWGKSGRQIIVSNISFVGSLAMICAITSRGGWFFSPLTSKNNSLVFIEFIKRLINWLTEDQSIKLKDIVILLDNSPIHCSNETMKYLDQIGWTIIFLAPYSPEYAPIELLFHMLKMNLAKHCKGIKVNLSKENGKKSNKGMNCFD